MQFMVFPSQDKDWDIFLGADYLSNLLVMDRNGSTSPGTWIRMGDRDTRILLLPDGCRIPDIRAVGSGYEEYIPAGDIKEFNVIEVDEAELMPDSDWHHDLGVMPEGWNKPKNVPSEISINFKNLLKK